MARDMSPIFPERVIVYYPTRRCKGEGDRELPAWGDISWEIEDVQFTDAEMTETTFKGMPETALIIHDACQAIWDGGGVGNKSKLDDLTSQIAQDFYDF